MTCILQKNVSLRAKAANALMDAQEVVHSTAVTSVPLKNVSLRAKAVNALVKLPFHSVQNCATKMNFFWEVV